MELVRSMAEMSLDSDTSFIVSIGKIMVEQEVLTEFALKILHNNIMADMESFETNEQKVRAGLYMTIVVNMAVFYGGYVGENKLDETDFNRLRNIALTFLSILPKLLRSITDKYLETYHGAKVASFVKGGQFDDYFPNHPDDQKIIDKVMAEETRSKTN